MRKNLVILIIALTNLAAYGVDHEYARDPRTQRPISIHEAHKEASYNCLKCREELIQKKGEKKAWHFAHKSGSTCNGGGPETVAHYRAKYLLVDHLGKWRFLRRCSRCMQPQGVPDSFPQDRGYTGHVEYRITSETGYRVADAMVMCAGWPIAALEVLQTHAVDEKKKAFLAEQEIAILEMHAEHIIAAYESGSFEVELLEHSPCASCVDIEKARNARPCAQCRCLLQKEELQELRNAPIRGAIISYACKDCVAACVNCDGTMTQDQQKYSPHCLYCREEYRAWKNQVKALVSQKISELTLERLQQIADSAPLLLTEQDRSWLDAERVRITQICAEQKEANRLSMEQAAIVKADAERAAARAQRIKWNQVAQNIVATERAYLRTSIEEIDQVKAAFGRWDPQRKKWYAELSNLTRCAQWLPDSAEIITRVRQMRQLPKKRKAPTLPGQLSLKDMFKKPR